MRYFSGRARRIFWIGSKICARATRRRKSLHRSGWVHEVRRAERGGLLRGISETKKKPINKHRCPRTSPALLYQLIKPGSSTLRLCAPNHKIEAAPNVRIDLTNAKRFQQNVKQSNSHRGIYCKHEQRI